MLTGRKLLLADDSAAIRKVIELTFSDEGMEVTSVSDGRAALEKLEQIAPDVVLADVFMPEIGGYEVCRRIKQNERFAQTPVMLLVSSFDPFDEAEARTAGADDVVAKPFQSIRQLVSRVGSLLRDSQAQPESLRGYETLGLQTAEPISGEQPSDDSNVTVLVEAPKLETTEPVAAAGATCVADVELQTADTRRLDEPIEGRHLDDTIEIEPVTDADRQSFADQYMNVDWNKNVTYEPVTEAAARSFVRVTDEPLLEIEEERGGRQVPSDDLVLDLDFEASETVEALHEPSVDQAAETAASEISSGQAAGGTQEPSTPETHAPMAATSAEPETLVGTQPEEMNLSPAVIDAIAQRVIERMSDKVVRDIAWEVVPELAELLIKQKLEEK